jgi:hypothetical protein
VEAETGNWNYNCARPLHGEGGHAWTVVPPAAATVVSCRDGYFAELDVYEDLIACIHGGDPWLEYGIVEDRYRAQAPDTYAALVAKFSHSARNAIRGGPDTDPDQSRKVSSRLAGALSHLAQEGLIAKSTGLATGYWSYNGTVTYWAAMPPPPADLVLSWEMYAEQMSLDPEAWKLPEAS